MRVSAVGLAPNGVSATSTDRGHQSDRIEGPILGTNLTDQWIGYVDSRQVVAPVPDPALSLSAAGTPIARSHAEVGEKKGVEIMKMKTNVRAGVSGVRK